MRENSSLQVQYRISEICQSEITTQIWREKPRQNNEGGGKIYDVCETFDLCCPAEYQNPKTSVYDRVKNNVLWLSLYQSVIHRSITICFINNMHFICVIIETTLYKSQAVITICIKIQSVRKLPQVKPYLETQLIILDFTVYFSILASPHTKSRHHFLHFRPACFRLSFSVHITHYRGIRVRSFF